MSATVSDGPIVQSITIGFRTLYAASLLLAIGWLATNIRQVPADSQAVVLRFGRVVDVRPAGLTIAWPRPIENVVLLPSADRQTAFPIPRVAPTPGLQDAYTTAMGADAAANAGAFLTGDGGIVLLDATLYIQVADARGYYLAQLHVPAALRRLFLASAVHVAAAHRLDDFLVTGDRQADGLEAARLALRGDLLADMNARAAALDPPLGIAIARIDLTASLPPQAKIAYDSVLQAGQQADQAIASARTDATRAAQEADRDHDRLLAEAHAQAAERLSDASARVAPIESLEARITTANRDGLIRQLYRDRIGEIFARAGRVTAADPHAATRLILPGTKP